MPVPMKSQPKAETVNPKIVYPVRRSEVREGAKALTERQIKDLLWWEDEDQYKERVGKGDKKKAAVGFGEEYLLLDPDTKKKVRCWYNTKNRPFSLQWASNIAQTILYSGPGLPIEQRRWQFNGEPMIFGNMGQCLSGQHRGIGLILAVSEWRKNREYWKLHGGWDTEPVLETTITFGVDESERTTRTIDNVKPRTLSDVFYTSHTFAKLRQSQREGCSRMLANAIQLLWKRTGVSDNPAFKFQNHGESVMFFDRHPRLLDCVNHINSLNTGGEGRQITDLNLSPGLVAGMMYLMGCSASDGDEYYTGIHARTERALNWDSWESACDFWTNLASGLGTFTPIRDAITQLLDPEHGEGGRQVEKVGVIAQAWKIYTEGGEFTTDNLKLTYDKDATTGKLSLTINDDFPHFGGIDKGEPKNVKDANKPVPNQEEIKKKAAEIREKNRIAELDATAKAGKKPETNGKSVPTTPPVVTSRDQVLRNIKANHPGKVILFRGPSGYTAWSNDAMYVGKILNVTPTIDGKAVKVVIAEKDYESVKSRLLKAKARLAVCEQVDGKPVVTDVV